MDIIQIPAFDDNYLYLLEDNGVVATVDPGDPQVIEAALKERGWNLDLILNTHHHADHVGGNKWLKKQYDCRIIGPSYDHQRIPGIDQQVSAGDVVKLGKAEAKVLFTPGHTRGHILYWFESHSALFCGDTLFHLGCGRMFEGHPEQMWDSMQQIRALPAETICYCAHEYSQANARFALTVDPANKALLEIAADIDQKRKAGMPTVPFKLGSNQAANPFLRADDPTIQEHLNLVGARPFEVFGAVRKLKDNF